MAADQPIPIPKRVHNLTGRKYDRLTVKRYGGSTDNGTVWLCECRCLPGKLFPVLAYNLTNWHTRSCGCRKIECTKSEKTSHGHTVDALPTAEYRAWSQMKNRCVNPECPAYLDYGGRGVTVWQGWLDDFPAFLLYVGPRPSLQHSLDRFPDNNGNYEPGNVRWATRREQGSNKRNNVLLTIGGETRCVAEWTRIAGLRRATIYARLKRGWSHDRVLGKVTAKRK